ncbi:MAG: selenocysteine-specific translation elongation factor [Spirochaetia bacterium]|nr:selenocysteine-specific translation elongation factor [Spirochaetia bacterium]
MHIIGTAGHVDHGKSALVHALTGEETDRLPEEKKRALTIELGFASYLDSIHQRIGVIDVPGHERFIRNMVSGTWAMQLALLVVASDDGWMAQTTDHAHVLKGMNVSSIIVVITKIDKVSAERVEEVRMSIEIHLNNIFSTTFPIHEVSAHNNIGIESLKELISKGLSALTYRNYPPMLYVDRSFVLKGMGTIVTGSLVGKEINVGENITLLPRNKVGKIRTLQMFNHQVTKAVPVSRCAIGLQGIGRDEIKKGDIVTTEPHEFTLVREVFVNLTPITPSHTIDIKNHTNVTIACGTYHAEATIHFLHEKKKEANTTLLCRLQLITGIYVYHNQPIVIMGVGSSKVLSYAKVVYTLPLNRNNQRSLASLFYSYSPIPSLFEKEEVIELYLYSYSNKTFFLPPSLIIEQEMYRKLGSYHIQEKLLRQLEKTIIEKASNNQGVPLQSAKFIKPYPAELAVAVIEHLIGQQKIILCEGSLLLASNQEAQLSKRASELQKEIELCGFEGYPVKLLHKSDKEHIGCLLRNKKIIIIDSLTIYLVTTYEKIISSLLDPFSIGETFSIAQGKENIRLSRKFMLPLLNQIERDGYIMRLGDLRKVMKKL